MKEPHVAIIILNWNGKTDTIACLDSLQKVTYPDYSIILLDNGSTDGSIEAFKDKYPYVTLIDNGKNLGFAGGNNPGIDKAMKDGADYIILLNNDTVVAPDFIQELVKAAESLNAGIVGPKMYYFEPKDMIYYAGGYINWYTGYSKHAGFRQTENGQHDEVKEVDFVNGACLMVKREVVEKLGGLPVDYFLMWEDIDYCINAKRHGYKVVYVPSSVIWHKISASIKKMRAATMYYGRRGNIIFIKKYASLPQKISSLIWLIFIYGTISSLYYAIRYRSLDILKYSLKGIIAGLRYDVKNPKEAEPVHS